MVVRIHVSRYTVRVYVVSVPCCTCINIYTRFSLRTRYEDGSDCASTHAMINVTRPCDKSTMKKGEPRSKIVYVNGIYVACFATPVIYSPATPAFNLNLRDVISL